MRIRGALAVAVLSVLSVLSGLALVAAPPAAAATGTTVTWRVATGSGLGFDAASATRPSLERAWTASPYRTVNIYFSGSQRHDTAQTELTADWVTTVMSNGWSLIPTVVDLQAPCYGGSKGKTSASTAQSDGQTAATNADSALQSLNLHGAVAYLDIENFDTSAGSSCDKAVQTFVASYVTTLHGFGDKAGVYFNAHHGAPSILALWGKTGQPDDVWVADWNGSATANDSVLGTKWTHHRLHQYVGNSTETYAGAQLNIDRDAIDGDVVAPTGVTTPSTSPYPYNVNGVSGTDTLNIRTQPNSSATALPTPLNGGDSIQIACQASGQTVNGDYVWDKLATVDPEYVSDLYTTTTGRNGFSSAIPRCDTTAPAVSLSALPQVVLGGSTAVRWQAADKPDPDGNPNNEARGVVTTVRYRYATWHYTFSGWRTLTTTSASSAPLSLRPGYTYCVQVMTRDLSGNASPWTPQTCTIRPLDDRSAAASSGWSRKTGSRFWMHTYTTTSRSGKTLSVTKVHARRVGVVATTCAKCGSLRVYVGSRFVGTINLHASGPHYQQLLVLKPFGLLSGTVRLVTRTNQLVQVDGVLIGRV